MDTGAIETRCEKCGRVLTDPMSITLGMGPCCREAEPYVCPYSIVIDSREQAPFFFEGLRMVKSRGGGIVQPSLMISGLPAGDYSIDGLESEIAIERKSLSDLYGTLGKGRDRFKRELEKLSAMKFAAVVVEAEWFDILNTPPVQSTVPPQSIEGTILAFMADYPVQWVLAQHRRHAEWITFQFLDRFWRKQMKDTSSYVKQMGGGNGPDSQSPGPQSGVF